MLARVFASAETLIAVVVIAEEFDPQNRGWGIGALGAIQATGAGLAALMFGFVDVLPWGWRSLYLVGLGPLMLVAWWRRALPETNRFVELSRERGTDLRSTPPLAPVLNLIREHPGRLAALCAVVFVLGVVISPATFFAPKYLQDVHGWSPGWVAALNFGGGAFAIVANPFAGWLSDRRGRRPVAIAFTFGLTLVVAAFYTGIGMPTPALWVPMIFGVFGAEVTLSAYGAELFPTSQRSMASGLRSFSHNVGAIAGLAAVSLLFVSLGSIWAAIAAVSGLLILAPLLVWLSFPETAGRSLEEIAPEAEPLRPPPDPARD